VARKSKKTKTFRDWIALAWDWLVWGLIHALLAFVGLAALAVGVYRFVDPPMTFLSFSEERRLGHISQEWVPLEAISPELRRAVVAAEDANFCSHWGFDMAAIRSAVQDGAGRGASTVTQQMVKNVYLWPGRNWGRKALEAVMTPLVEILWPKRRILEVYLNVAEFDEGVFGAEAAAARGFGRQAMDLTADQAALLAAVLPNPKARSVKDPTDFLRERAAAIRDGAETLRRDGRAACFED